MKRIKGLYCYTIIRGEFGKDVTFLLVPPYPEDLREMIVSRACVEGESVTFCREADRLETYRYGDFNIEMLVPWEDNEHDSFCRNVYPARARQAGGPPFNDGWDGFDRPAYGARVLKYHAGLEQYQGSQESKDHPENVGVG